ncbi:MAG: NADH-quinone oxidoreductase subunit N [Proteobacteria bacterium]|nr:NADH-quinone oxidoreductase subunit N [Pseudomonadota bacterium]
MGNVLTDIVCFIPEVALGTLILIFLTGAVFLKKEIQEGVLLGKLMFGIFAGIGGLVILQSLHPLYIFNDLFVSNTYTTCIKFLVLSITICVYAFSFSSLKIEKILGIELYIFVLMALLGMFVMIGAYDFMSFYLGMELQNSALYILIAFKKESLKNNEAAVKYFILGVVASGIFLFGASLLYGAVGSLNFQNICNIFVSSHVSYVRWGGCIGLLFIIASFLFKLALVPFHMWAPDVYEGIPLPIVGFLALIPKMVILSIILHLWILLFPIKTIPMELDALKIFPPLLKVASLLSILVGTFGAFGQLNIKRFIAYSGISHMGFIVLGIVLGNYNGMYAAIIYLLSYLIMGVGFFSCLCALRYPQGFSRLGIIKDLSDLKGLSKTHPSMSFMIALLMISFAGLPPFIGFFSKLYLLLSFIESGFIGVAIFVGLLSIIAAVYYLRIIKYLYFDETEVFLDVVCPFSFFVPVLISLAGTVFFFLYSKPLFWCVSFVMKALLEN